MERGILCWFAVWGGCIVGGAVITRVGTESKVAVVMMILVTRTHFAQVADSSALM